MRNVVVSRLRDLGGAARAQDLGFRARSADLREALASGLVHRPVRGVYALTGAPPAAVAGVVHRATVGCVSAAELLGLAVLARPHVPHLSVPRDRGSRPSTLRNATPAVVHRESWVRPGPAQGVVHASVDDALARMLVCCDPVAALVTIDHALRLGRTTRERIRAALPSTTPSVARRVLARSDGRSMSPLETVTRLALRRAGLPVVPGVAISGVGLVDLVVAGRVVVELDGYEFHRDRAQFREDRRRDRALVAMGYLVLRFTAHEVFHDIDGLVAAVLSACARAGVGRAIDLGRGPAAVGW